MSPARRKKGSTRAKTPATTRALGRRELAALRREVRRRPPRPLRLETDPEDVQRSVAQLVLALVEFLRQVMERQAIRRMNQGTLSDDQTEALGTALMELEKTVREMAERFGLKPEDLNLDLGPLGKLT